MNTFSIRASFKRAWELFRANKLTLVASSAVLIVLSNLTGDDKVWYKEWGIFGIVAFIAIALLSMFAQIGWLKLTLKIESGAAASFKELFAHGELFFKYLGTVLVYGIILAIGLILLIIPGFYVLMTYSFAPIVAIDKDLSIKQSFDESARISKRVKWKLLGLMVVSVALNLLGGAFFLVGLLLTMPITTLAYAHVYRTLSRREAHATLA